MGPHDDTTPPVGFDLERPSPSPRGERWMVRGDDGRSSALGWEVVHGEGLDAADRAVDAMRAHLGVRPGARIELHTEKGCGHLHLRALLVQDHDGLWEPFLSPLSAPPNALPLVAERVRHFLAGSPARVRLFPSKGGDA